MVGNNSDVNPVPDKTFFKRVDDTMLEMYARGADDTQWEHVVLNVDTNKLWCPKL